jgi:large subunit ribosomal protein LP2
MELLLSQLSGKDITELIAAGREKFASVPCGGGGVAVAAAAPAAGGAAPAAEAKKEEKVEEKEESDDVRSLTLPLIPICHFLFPIAMKTSCY